MLSATILCVLAFAWSSNAELVLEVTPEFVLPDSTPSFSLRCGLAEFEEGSVNSLTISRVITPGNLTTAAVTQPIATVGGLYPSLPAVNASFPLVTANGQISLLEGELGTYLEVIWPNPSVEELGLYQCEAEFFSFGILSLMVAQVPVSTSDPVIDSLLLKIYDLETLVGGLNETLGDLQAQVTEIQQKDAAREVDETTTTMATTSTTVAEPSDANILQELNVLSDHMFELNKTVGDISQRVNKLEQKDTSAKSTGNETTKVPDISSKPTRPPFEAGNSTQHMFTALGPASSAQAQKACEKEGFQLTEISDEQEFNAIAGAVLPIVQAEAGDVLVAGIREAERPWYFSASNTQVSFFKWTAGHPAQNELPVCIALTPVDAAIEMKSVPCNQPQSHVYFLCEA